PGQRRGGVVADGDGDGRRAFALTTAVGQGVAAVGVAAGDGPGAVIVVGDDPGAAGAVAPGDGGRVVARVLEVARRGVAGISEGRDRHVGQRRRTLGQVEGLPTGGDNVGV